MIVTTEHGDVVDINGRIVVELLRESFAELEKKADGAYNERNRVVVAFAKLAQAVGWHVYRTEHEGDLWEDEWRALLVIETPAGQVSWHFHDDERPWLAPFPHEPARWDGHTTAEKYERLELATALGPRRV